MSGLRVLYLADRFDGPYRYRCLHACEQLRADGACANVMRSDDPAVLTALTAYSVVVLFRLPWGSTVEAIVARARSAGIPLVFDVDDLVFDPACGDLMPFRSRYSDAAWEHAYAKNLRALRRTLEACDLALVSSPALAEHAERLGKTARVHPNLVSPLYLGMANRTRRARAMLRPARTIGYFSGSDTHDADLAAIAEPLRRVLLANPAARLLLCGHLDDHALLRGVETRIVRLPYLSWRVYPWALASCDVTLAPLAAINAFTDGKSALKFFEAGALGVPAIASPARELARAIQPGISGWLAESEAEWFDALSQALTGNNSERAGAEAKEAVLREHSFEAHRGKLRGLLTAIAGVAKGRQPAARAIAWDEYSGRPGKVADARARGRRALELATLMRVLRTPRPAGPDLEQVDRWLDALLLDEKRVGSGGATVALLGDPERGGWRPNEQLSATGSLPGELRATGTDPHWLSQKLVPSSAVRARYLVLRMRAVTERPRASAQLFWQTARRADAVEARSVRIPITADGTDRTILIDLWQADPSGFWRKRRRTLWLRFDPLDRPGTVSVSALALLPEAWTPPAFDVDQARSTKLTLPNKRKHALVELRAAVSGVRTGDRLRIVAERDPGWMRRVLEGALGDAAIRVESIRAHERETHVDLVGTPRPGQAGVDVVVPVHNARKQTLCCLRSVLRHAEGDFRLVVIDDASTDPKLWPALLELARRKPRMVTLRNRKNLGFAATVNRGISHAGGRDVIVLNSDTKVFAEFLPRLRDAAYADAQTGIVCPLSNNATICSAPEFCRDNPLPPGISAKRMARLVRRISTSTRPELVTPVGFCMYLKRELLEKVGVFDAERYGRGFGEENDLGERAKARGFSIRLADDVYVLHEGRASFGELGKELEAKNAKVLEAQHPGYHAQVAQFIRENPLAEVHANLKWHLRRRSDRRQPAVLELLHSSPFGPEPGGTEHVVRDLVRALRLPRVVLAYPCEVGIEVAEVIDGDVSAPLKYSFPLATVVPRFAHRHSEAEAAFERVLELFQVGAVHLHHLFHWPLSIAEVLRRRGVPYVVTLHDFYSICPSANLLDVTTQKLCCPRRASDRAQVKACLGALCSQLAVEPPLDAQQFLDEHRAAFATLLDGAMSVIFPSTSARDLVTGVHGLNRARLRVWPHGYDPPAPAGTDSRTESGTGPLRVALLGEVSYAAKGAKEYLSVIAASVTDDIEWHVFGNSDRFGFEQKLAALGARIVRHGPYRRSEVSGMLERSAIDVGLMLPVWPETFSLTLSELLGAGIPVIAARQGALVDRLFAQPYGILVDDAKAAVGALRRLAGRTDELTRMQQAARDFRHPPVAPWAGQHGELYARGLQLAPDFARARLGGAGLRELGESRIRTLSAVSSVVTTRPASRYTSAWWYPWAERFKPLVPESLRAFARRWLAADGLRVTHRLRMPGPRAELGSELRVVRHYLGTTLLESLGSDPHLLLTLPPTRPESIQAVCFNLWCSHPNAAFAQLYWRHGSDNRFSEEKSITIPLDARSGAWQEYVVRLDDIERRDAWRDGGNIVALRFDPINLPGLIGLGELTLCAAPPQLGDGRARFVLTGDSSSAPPRRNS